MVTKRCYQKRHLFGKMVAKALSCAVGEKFEYTKNGLVAPPSFRKVVHLYYRSKPFLIEEFAILSAPDNLNGILEEVWDKSGCLEELGDSTNWILFCRSCHRRILVFTKDLELLKSLCPQRRIFAMTNVDTSIYCGVM